MAGAPLPPDDETCGVEGAEADESDVLDEEEELVDESELAPPPHPASEQVNTPKPNKARTEVSVDDFMDDDPSDTGNVNDLPFDLAPYSLPTPIPQRQPRFVRYCLRMKSMRVANFGSRRFRGWSFGFRESSM
jgi:hypothetical protein